MPEFADILAAPGVREVSRLRPGVAGRIGFMAYHGGNLELRTDAIADAAASGSGASYYGVLQPEPMRRHLASIKVDPAESTRLAAFIAHVDIVVTVHGFGRRGLFTSLLLGGGNRVFAQHVGDALRAGLPAYEIITDLDAIPKQLRGMHASNPVNLPADRGVQIELPPRVRGSSPLWWDWEGPGLTPHTLALIDALVVAAVSWQPRLSEGDRQRDQHVAAGPVTE